MGLFKKKKKKVKSPLVRQLPQAIVYLSDFFMFFMTITWILYIIVGIIAGCYALVTFQDTTIFTDLKDACTYPLFTYGALWMVRCMASHYNANRKGQALPEDFPNYDEDGNIIHAKDPFKEDLSSENNEVYPTSNKSEEYEEMDEEINETEEQEELDEDNECNEETDGSVG